MSSAFSGIGAADVAVETLLEGIRVHTDRSMTYRNLFCIEYDSECQMELLSLGTPPEHLVEDILGLVHQDIYALFHACRNRWSYRDYVKWLTHTKRRFVRPSAPCILHPSCGNQGCELSRADVHVAGTPCPDFSTFSNKPNEFQGDQLPCLMIWIGQRLLLQEPFILHENVPGINASTIAPLEELLSPMYIIQTCVFDSYNLGHPCHRVRRLTWLLHRSKVIISPSVPWTFAIERFFRDLKCSYHVYMIADDQQKHEELSWCLSRTNSGGDSVTLEDRKQNALKLCTEHAAFGRVICGALTSNEFFDALLVSEQDRLLNYWLQMSGYNSQTTACGLGQDPLARPWHNSGRHSLMCLLRNSHIIWDFKHKRWLEPHELLLAQAFPVLGRSSVQCSFSQGRPSAWPKRQRQHMVFQAGNSMNVHSVGCALVWLAMELPLRSRPQTTDALLLLRDALTWRT